MSKFDGKNFYGFSIRNDPNLVTTTKNFEFRYTQPEFLQKAIQKVHNIEDPKINQKNMMWYNYCRLRETSNKSKEHTDTHTKDPNTESQINTHSPNDTGIVRDLSDREVDKLIGIAKHEAPLNEKCTTCSPYEEDMSTASDGVVHICKRVLRNKNHKEESCVETKDINQDNIPFTFNNLTNDRSFQIHEYVEQHPTLAQIPRVIDNIVLEEYRRPQPKWVEIVEPNKESRLETEIKGFYLKSSRPQFPHAHEYANCSEANIHMPHCLPAVLMTEAITDNVHRADKYMNTNHCFAVEDSDVELNELRNGTHFATYIKPRPDEMLNLSFDDDNDRVAEFIETKVVENLTSKNHPNVGELIQSDMPHVTEQYVQNSIPSNLIDFHEQFEQNNRIQIFINDLKKQQCRNMQRTLSESTKTPHRSSPRQKDQQQSKRKAKPTLRPQHLQKTFESSLTEGNGTSNPNSPYDRSIRSSTPEQTQTRNASRIRSKFIHSDKESRISDRHSHGHNNLCISKSIEDLKTEKTFIFKKMTKYQEKMIEVLDKLRLSLSELHAPENSYDKSKRQKNAFEFSVRFSRNFLYPLKGMKEDLKMTAAEQFNSLTSNEACNRVCYLYNLLLQSLNTYQKQLRFFLLDHVPQKLTSLIEMIYTSTAICLDKDIFSKQDAVVDCLQQRCLKFLGFLEDFQEGRLQMTSKSNRKLTQEKAQCKYDLKMFMNDLNMYEPKLVPKVVMTDRSAKSKKNKPKKPSNQVIVYDLPDTLLEKPPEDTIPTQVQSISNTKSYSCPMTSQLDMASGNVIPLDKDVIEALQMVTKEQIRQVLKPILDSLGSALGNQNNSEAIEAILNAFNVKVFPTSDAENKQNFDDKYAKKGKIKTFELSSVHSVESTCKSLKAAKQTNTLRQQNSHEALSKKHPSTSSTTGITVDDDNNDNGNNNRNRKYSNNNANSKSNSNISTSTIKTNSTTYLRGGVDGGGDFCGGGGGDVVGECSNKINHMGEQTSMTTTTPNERVLKKIVNEDQIYRAGSQSEDTQTIGNQHKDDFQVDVSTSDSEGEVRDQRKSKNVHKSSDSCSSVQQTSHSQSQSILPNAESCHSSSRLTKNKRNPLPMPPSNTVTPSTMGKQTNNKNRDSHAIQTQRTGGQRDMLMAARASSNKSTDLEIKFKEQKANFDCNTDFILRQAAGRVELPNKCSTSDDSLRIKSTEREQHRINPIQPPFNKTLLSATNLYDKPLKVESREEQTNQKDCNENSNVNKAIKPDLHIDEMIKERDCFLDLCGKNRFYRNPNYAEPWKVFSSISERLLNDVLNCVENDFATGVSKFVEDFLQLETKT